MLSDGLYDGTEELLFQVAHYVDDPKREYNFEYDPRWFSRIVHIVAELDDIRKCLDLGVEFDDYIKVIHSGQPGFEDTKKRVQERLDEAVKRQIRTEKDWQ